MSSATVEQREMTALAVPTSALLKTRATTIQNTYPSSPVATVEVIMNRLLRTRLSVRAIRTYERARLMGTTNAVIVTSGASAARRSQDGLLRRRRRGRHHGHC